MSHFEKVLTQEGNKMVPFEENLNPQMKEYVLLKCFKKCFLLIQKNVLEEYHPLRSNYHLTAPTTAVTESSFSKNILWVVFFNIRSI